jgi:hypothetical protein
MSRNKTVIWDESKCLAIKEKPTALDKFVHFLMKEVYISIINSLGQCLYLEKGNGSLIKSILRKRELYINI